jgi:hypothetical protein
MQLADTYFEQLISSADAITALSVLAEFWSTRADRSKDRLGLAPAEFHVHLYAGMGSDGIELCAPASL